MASSLATSKAIASATAAAPGGRLVALDWMRGLVMLLMALDHSSGEFNAGRLFTDGSFVYHQGTPLPAAQFLTRWVTHLCAPTFVFLAGASLALQVGRRRASGESAWAIDRHLLLRGLVIAAFEILGLLVLDATRQDLCSRCSMPLARAISSWFRCAACRRRCSSRWRRA